MSTILAVQTSFPEHEVSQTDVMGLMSELWPQYGDVLKRLATTSGVEKRRFVLPLLEYPKLKGFGPRNQVYQESSFKMLKACLDQLNQSYDFKLKDIGAIFSTTITGISVPSVEARLMNHFAFDEEVTRTPIFGLGCLGGVALLNRAHDWLKVYPDKLALVLASEVCSLTLQLDDVSMSNMIGASLFGDGAAVVLMAGEKHPLAQKGNLKILDHHRHFYPNTEKVMGWDIVDNGFKLILSGNVPEIVEKYVKDDVQKFLKKNHYAESDINFFVSHPGGPKVLKSIANIMQRPDAEFAGSWESLKNHGNLSSVSVLTVLAQELKRKTSREEFGLAMAMGPAFNAEMTLLKKVSL